MSALPWGTLLRSAVKHLGVAPDAFWRISLREWNAVAADQIDLTMTREHFEQLCARYPDTKP